MAANQAFIVETILGMRKAINKRQDASDSEETINAPSNRGNKLKRKATFVHEGQADLPSGPTVYREVMNPNKRPKQTNGRVADVREQEVDHAGYKRYILSRNPPRLDEDGDELDDDEIDEEADAAARAENVYGEIRLEEVLAPLTSAADLPNHPSLSFPYLSKTLPELAKQASDMVHREKASLWKAKQLLMKFRGDEDWAPCGMMESDNDIALFGPIGFEAPSVRPGFQQITTKEQSIVPGRDQHTAGAADGSEGIGHRAKKTKHTSGNGSSDRGLAALDKDSGEIRVFEDGPEDITMVDVPKEGAATNEGHTVSPDEPHNGVGNDRKDIANVQDPNSSGAITDNTGLGIDIGHADAKNDESSYRNKNLVVKNTPDDQTLASELDVEAEEESSQPPLHRMTTRAQALATASNTPPRSRSHSPSPNSPPPTWVHPFFMVPESAKPDWNFGLPLAEAADTRRLLLLYVQKQEEVCRGAEQLRDGLLKANRRRKEVWKWTKAEAHVGEMSDGEDWYDKAEWGLDEDLKKGKEEEDDDGGKEGKKTRGRRA